MNRATPLHEACDSEGHEGHLGCARLLLEARAHVDAEANIGMGTHGWGMGTPLHTACYNGHLDLARLLVEAGADLKARPVRSPRPLFDSMMPIPPSMAHAPGRRAAVAVRVSLC